ncbi:hypothetical protein MYP_3961 [Sporocytophaga myxococcoides]|uniref:Uncharacterized protein n=1 Tax=Sporocytophaga myxococcoides TaxID=153721 RepID=A0A098LIF4_9BACT|nr:hypothetical protein [Sporocytophaga myxococcoides]GAL86731.1 hypothetical protein MYP_3961 [Sporocytophaga myxococcoides]
MIINRSIYGALTLTEGDCMPKLGGNSCKTYPVRRKIRVYEYPENKMWKAMSLIIKK